jgi:AcrR family transcriptional regulator
MAEKRRRGGATEKGQQVATGILDAAVEVLADHGTAGASLQRIADRAGVDKRVLGYYFGDRDGVLAAVAGRIGDRLLAASEEALADVVDPDVGFAIGFGLMWDTVVREPRLHAAHLALVTASISDPTLRDAAVAVRDRYDRLIQERATEAEKAGWVWVMDKATMSQLVIAGLQGLTLDYLQRGDTPQLRDALEVYQAQLQVLAHRA